VEELRGDRQSVGDRRPTALSNRTTPLDPRMTFYLTTDGLLDQAGGPRGFSFGRERFAELMRRHARRPFREQRTAFDEALADYQGEHSQRDDITVLSFRFAPSEELV